MWLSGVPPTGSHEVEEEDEEEEEEEEEGRTD